MNQPEDHRIGQLELSFNEVIQIHQKLKNNLNEQLKRNESEAEKKISQYQNMLRNVLRMQNELLILPPKPSEGHLHHNTDSNLNLEMSNNLQDSNADPIFDLEAPKHQSEQKEMGQLFIEQGSQHANQNYNITQSKGLVSGQDLQFSAFIRDQGQEQQVADGLSEYPQSKKFKKAQSNNSEKQDKSHSKCKKHQKQKIYYVLDEQDKQKEYLCNQCYEVLDKKQSFSIKCGRHRNKVMFRLKNQPASEMQQDQKFLCQSCPEAKEKIVDIVQKSAEKSQLILICNIHSQPIQNLCFEYQCFNKGQFLVCPGCTSHVGHQTQPKSMDRLIELSAKNKIALSEEAHQIINLSNIPETLELRAKKILCKYCYSNLKDYLDSFFQQTSLLKMREKLLIKGQKEIFTKIWWVAQVLKKQLNCQKRQNLLRAIYHLLVSYDRIMWNRIQFQLVDYYGKKVPFAIDLSSEEAENLLQQAFQSIIIIDNNRDQALFKFGEAKIDFSKSKRILMYNSKRTSECLALRKQIIKNLRETIQKQDQQQNKQNRLQSLYKFFIDQDISEIEKYFQRKEIEKIKQSKEKFQDIQEAHFTIQNIQDHHESQCLPNQLELGLDFFKYNFTNLKVVDLRFSKDEWGFNRYSISAFILFGILKSNYQIQLISISGLTIIKFDQFTSLFRMINNPTSFENEDQDDSSRHFVKGMRQSFDWLKSLSYNRRLRLCLDVELYFNFKNAEIVAEKVQNIVCFSKIVDMQNIRITIDHQTNVLTKQLKDLLTIIQKTRNCKICISSPSYSLNPFSKEDSFYCLLKQLAQCKTIDELEIKSNLKPYLDISFQQLKSAQLNDISQVLENIFANNSISSLCVRFCKNFPQIKKQQYLKVVKLIKSTFFLGEQTFKKLLNVNPNLRSIQLHSITNSPNDKNQPISNLLYLQDISIKQSSGLILKELIGTKQPMNNLKSLIIQCFYTDSGIEREPLVIPKEFYQKLTVLQNLDLSNVQYHCDDLLSIPSNSLKRICLSKNNEITNQELIKISSRWKDITQLRIPQCPKVTAQIFQQQGIYPNLLHLKIDERAFQQKRIILQTLIQRAVRVKLFRQRTDYQEEQTVNAF